MIINLLDQSGVWICNILRVSFNWEIWRVKTNTTIINMMMIGSPHDSWNHRTDFCSSGTESEVSCWRLVVPLSWWLIWFFIVKGVELINIYSKIWWEAFMATDDAGINLVSNPSTALTSNLPYYAEICNNWMKRLCIIDDGILRHKMLRALTWSGQCCWSSNNI